MNRSDEIYPPALTYALNEAIGDKVGNDATAAQLVVIHDWRFNPTRRKEMERDHAEAMAKSRGGEP